MHWILMSDQEYGSFNFLKLKYGSGNQIILTFCRIGSPLFNLRKSEKTKESTGESCTMHWILMNFKEFGSFKFLKIKYRTGEQIIQTFCKIGSPQEFRSRLFNLRKFWKTEESTGESCTIHWFLMYDKEFWSFKVFKIKYRRGNQIIQTFYRIGSPSKIRSPHVNLRKSWKTEKSTAELCRMNLKLVNFEEFG